MGLMMTLAVTALAVTYYFRAGYNSQWGAWALVLIWHIVMTRMLS